MYQTLKNLTATEQVGALFIIVFGLPLLRTSWFMVFVFWIGWLDGDWVALTLFGLVSFFALHEFMTLSPTRRGDHRSLVLAFFVVLPLQYGLVGSEHFDLFTVFILVFFLVLVVQTGMLAQHLAARKLRWARCWPASRPLFRVRRLRSPSLPASPAHSGTW